MDGHGDGLGHPGGVCVGAGRLGAGLCELQRPEEVILEERSDGNGPRDRGPVGRGGRGCHPGREEEPGLLGPSAARVGEELLPEALLQVLDARVVPVSGEPRADGSRPVGDLRRLGEERADLAVRIGPPAVSEFKISVVCVLNHVGRTDEVAVHGSLEGTR